MSNKSFYNKTKHFFINKKIILLAVITLKDFCMINLLKRTLPTILSLNKINTYRLTSKRCCIFDLNGTVVNNQKVHLEASMKYLIDQKVYDKKKFDEISKLFPSLSSLESASLMKKKFPGITESTELMLQKLSIIGKEVISSETISYIPGFEKLISQLNPKTCFLITNSTRSVFQKNDSILNIGQNFKEVITLSDTGGERKQTLKPFNLFESLYGKEFSSRIFFDNSIQMLLELSKHYSKYPKMQNKYIHISNRKNKENIDCKIVSITNFYDNIIYEILVIKNEYNRI
jgi:hypothetical protein